MANYDSKNLLVWVKAMSRGQALPLDASEIHDSLSEAQTYASSPIAYGGQTIKAKLEDGKYHEYILQPSDAGYVLEEVGAVNESNLKQYVKVVATLPESGQEEGILYIVNTEGYIWTGSAWRKVFWDTTSEIASVSDRVDELTEELTTKAPIDNPIFSGVVKVGEDEVALKSYVDGLFANLASAEPGIVDSSNPLPLRYKAGQHFRVAEDGVYAGVECEVGDLILVVKNYVEDTASNDDFMVLQANVDGAVTSASNVSTIGEIVVFDSVTGKVIKGSGIQISSLNDVIAKMHEHQNKSVLDSYDKSQSDLLAIAREEATALVESVEDTINAKFENVVYKGTTLAEYGITDAYTKSEEDVIHKQITDNLNTKVTAAEVDDKIELAKEAVLIAASENTNDAINAKIGDIGDSADVVSYVDKVVGSGGADVSNQIDKCLTDAKAYTDEQLAAALEIVEF